MKTVTTIYDAEEALVVHSLLQAHGIKNILPEYLALSTMPENRVALGGFRILVPVSQFQDAQSIIAAGKTNATKLGTHCHSCGSPNMRSIRHWLPSVLLFYYFGGPFAFNSRKLRCRSCGYKQIRD